MIDTHAHLHLINRPLSDVLSAAKQAGLDHIIQVAIDRSSIEKNIDVYNQYPQISVSGGIHPLSVTNDLSIPDTIQFIEENIIDFVAIGETGLDFKYGQDNAKLQLDWFYAQLDLAHRFDKPVIIHSRYADDDMIQVVNQYPKLKKVFHCYATKFEFFELLKGVNNYVSFTGMITFSKKGKLANAVRNIPLNRMMIETDAPYLLPKGVQANQNSPEFVGFIADHIALLRNIELADVVNQTTQNAKEFFKIN